MDEIMLATIEGGETEFILNMMLPIFGAIFLVMLALHFIYGWLISRIAKKNGYPSPWVSYIPIAQFSVLLSLGGQSGKHVFWMFLPFVGMFIFFYFIIIATINLCSNNGESKHFIWVLASPFVGLWGLYRLGTPGGGIPLNKTQQALVQTCRSLIQQGKSQEEIVSMMMQAGVGGSEVNTIYQQAKSGAPMASSESPTRTPLSGKMIAALFILGFVLNSIIGTVFGALFGRFFIPSDLGNLENLVNEELYNEALWDESSFEQETEPLSEESWDEMLEDPSSFDTVEDVLLADPILEEPDLEEPSIETELLNQDPVPSPTGPKPAPAKN